MQMALLKWKLKYQEMEQGFPIAVEDGKRCLSSAGTLSTILLL